MKPRAPRSYFATAALRSRAARSTKHAVVFRRHRPGRHAQSKRRDVQRFELRPERPGPKAASQIPDCEGGFAGIFNLSGNVDEWENSCSG